jgi:hypothetical protein
MTDSVPRAIEELRALRDKFANRSEVSFPEFDRDVREIIEILIRLLEQAKDRKAVDDSIGDPAHDQYDRP